MDHFPLPGWISPRRPPKDDVAHLNTQLDAWVADIADVRRRPRDEHGRTVDECLGAERDHPVPLPAHRFATDHVAAVRSGKQPYVRFDKNDYSIPHHLVRKPLTLIASETLVRIVDAAEEVARHERCYGRRRRVEEPAHLAALARDKRERAHRARPPSRELCARRRAPRGRVG